MSYDVIDRFFQEAFKEKPKFLGWDSRSMKILTGSHRHSPRALYSYGTHFPMALAMGVGTKNEWWLLNGDTYSVTTNRHQGHTRSRANSDERPSVILPFTVLANANIDYKSIQIIDADPERNIEHKHSSANYEDVPKWRNMKSIRVPVEPNEDGKYSWVGYDGSEYGVHTVDTLEELPEHAQTTYDRVPIEPDEDGLYHWTTTEHFLGATLIKAKYEVSRNWETRKRRNKWAYFLSAFDANEPDRSRNYFFAELPKGEYATIADAYEGLKPLVVRRAEEQGRNIVRQGDIFAIEFPEVDTRELKKRPGAKVGKMNATIETHDVVVGSNNSWNSQRMTGNLHRAGLTEEEGYQLCAVWNACTMLGGTIKPLFMEPVTLPDPELVGYSRLMNTSHVATETVVLPDGITYARGTMRHRPESLGGFSREPEHVMQRLGKNWHLIVQNTVPKAKDGTSRAWQSSGSVD